jgi:hypothetical protein
MILVCPVANATDRINGEDAVSQNRPAEISGKSEASAIPIPLSAADGAAVRGTLLELISKYEVIVATWESQRALDAFADARNTLDGVADEDLAVLAPALPNFYDCIHSTDRLLETVQSMDATPYTRSMTPGLPDVDYFTAWPCLNMVEPGKMSEIQQAMQAARTVHMVASWWCLQSGFGFNSAVACAVTESIYQGLLWAWEDLELCADWQTANEVTANYERAGHIHGDLEDVVDTLMDIHVNIEILGDTLGDMHEDIDTIQETLDGFIEAFNKFAARDLRIKIENNLAGHGVHPNGIALFQLPASLGGYLDTARVIVVETIESMGQAGENILNAEARLAQGDNEYQAGNYKRAYQRYSEAYAAAAKPIGAQSQQNDASLISESDAAQIIAMLQHIFDYGRQIELPETADLDGSGYISLADLVALIAKVRAESQNNLDGGDNPTNSDAVEIMNSNERK